MSLKWVNVLFFGGYMCKFKMIVDTKTAADIAEAKRRFEGMPVVSSVKVAKNNRTVIAEAEITGYGSDRLRLTGWAKDNFGMHRSMNPSVEILAA